MLPYDAYIYEKYCYGDNGNYRNEYRNTIRNYHGVCIGTVASFIEDIMDGNSIDFNNRGRLFQWLHRSRLKQNVYEEQRADTEELCDEIIVRMAKNPDRFYRWGFWSSVLVTKDPAKAIGAIQQYPDRFALGFIGLKNKDPNATFGAHIEAFATDAQYIYLFEPNMGVIRAARDFEGLIDLLVNSYRPGYQLENIYMIYARRPAIIVEPLKLFIR